MSNRDIFCDTCGTFVGTIRDAKLMKGLKFICPNCDTQHKTKKEFESYDSFDSIFGNVFSKKQK